MKLTVVTNSELGTFRDCPMLHHLRYREGLRPRERPHALAVGSAFHDAVADAYEALKAAGGTVTAAEAPVLVEAMIERAQARVDRDLTEWYARTALAEDIDLDDMRDESQRTRDMVRFMVERFFRATGTDLYQLRLVDFERPFNVPVRDAIGRVGPLRMAGVIDAIWYEVETNSLIVDEHKTISGTPYGLEKRVEMDPQTTAYQYAVREAARAGEFPGVPADAQVRRVRYNAAKKAFPREPKINKDGRVSSALIDTTPEIYEAALVDQASRGLDVTEKQRERLDALRQRPDEYFARFEYWRTDEEIERWRWETYTDAARIRAADRDPKKRTRNTGHCNMPWSMPCRYRAICLDPDVPELRAGFTVTEARHTEVVDAVEARKEQNDGD